MCTVLLVQRIVCDYRAPLYRALRMGLAERGIDFQLAAGAPRPAEGFKDASDEVPFSIGWCIFPSSVRRIGRTAFWLTRARRT